MRVGRRICKLYKNNDWKKSNHFAIQSNSKNQGVKTMSKKTDRQRARAFLILSKAVHDKCLHDCCCNDFQSWQKCQAETTCPLWPYRLGDANAFTLADSKKKAQNYTGKTQEEQKKGHSLVEKQTTLRGDE